MVYYLNQNRYVQRRIDRMMGWVLTKQPKKVGIKKTTGLEELTKLFETASMKETYDVNNLCADIQNLLRTS